MYGLSEAGICPPDMSLSRKFSFSAGAQPRHHQGPNAQPFSDERTDTSPRLATQGRSSDSSRNRPNTGNFAVFDVRADPETPQEPFQAPTTEIQVQEDPAVRSEGRPRPGKRGRGTRNRRQAKNPADVNAGPCHLLSSPICPRRSTYRFFRDKIPANLARYGPLQDGGQTF